MKDFSEIKREYEDKCYSLKDLKMSIFAFKLIRFLLSELFFFIISLIPFLLGWFIITGLHGYSTFVTVFFLTVHFLFYIFYVKKLYNKDILPNFTEVNLIIEALRQIKIEKSKIDGNQN